tara:strand:+ start:431 stop:580 length:150 start_codon:yes stop_codon:yes gene_type:complete
VVPSIHIFELVSEKILILYKNYIVDILEIQIEMPATQETKTKSLIIFLP